MTIEIPTDTATICIFDPECLAHRKGDDGDWWSIPEEELREVNAGNVLFLDVGEDGTYFVNILSKPFDTEIKYNITTISGKLFIGPGEDVSGGELEPDETCDGEFINLDPGNYICGIRRADNVIDVFTSSGGDGRNSLINPIEI